ncbi:MAG: radical SAM family heme chaperone HemW, partial [Arenicellales bacterium]|nr:radical SAM family heme chaperone HemW [Arenicellales bacterium]
MFSAHSVAAVLESTHKLIGLADKAEITLEANPGSANAKRFAAYRDAGVNRLSLGLQSFSDPQLKALGRIHDESQSRQAVMAARDAGFEQINIDLMHGLPGQSTSAAAHDIESAIAFSPEHLSLYQLTIEPNTQFAAEPPPLPDEETCWQIRCTLEERATGAGFERYEVSAFSRPVNRCRHNLNYWEFGD